MPDQEAAEVMTVMFVIGCWILWPILCYNLAARKGRSRGIAVVAGVLFGLFAVLYYATVGYRETFVYREKKR